METPDLTDLQYDGDTTEVSGYTVRLRVETDQDASINDYDSDGRTEWTRDNDYGAVRPHDFTGRARILNRDRGYSLWWEPPGLEITGTPWDEATLRQEETRMRQLVEFGFVSVGLELLKGEDAYGRPIVVNAVWIGGIEWDYDHAYLTTVLSDIWAEIAPETP